jgi:hypothetical protein
MYLCIALSTVFLCGNKCTFIYLSFIYFSGSATLTWRSVLHRSSASPTVSRVTSGWRRGWRPNSALSSAAMLSSLHEGVPPLLRRNNNVTNDLTMLMRLRLLFLPLHNYGHREVKENTFKVSGQFFCTSAGITGTVPKFIFGIAAL